MADADDTRSGLSGFDLGPWRVEPGLDQLVGESGRVDLEPRTMDLLLCLVRHAGETVTKETILTEVWKGAIVVEGVIPKTVSALRQALGDDVAAPRFILTVPRRGYRLVAAVRGSQSSDSPARGTDAPSEAPASTSRPRAGARFAVAVGFGLLLGALALGVWLTRGPRGRDVALRSSREPAMPEAVERLFLEARLLWSRRGPDDVLRAHALLEQVAREAPDSADAHGWLALSWVTRGNYRGEPAIAFAHADAEAARALELDADSAAAHAGAGLVALNRRLDIATAIAEQRRALALDSSFAPARQYLAEALSAAGHHDAALATLDEALRQEPLSAVLHGVRGLLLLRAGRPLGALEAFDRTLVLDPRFGWLHRYRAYALASLGREQEACAALLEEAAMFVASPDELDDGRREVARDGLAGYWRWRLRRMEELAASESRPRPTQLAEALAGSGRFDEALAELARAPAAEDGEYFLYYRSSPAFDPIRDRPAFRALYAALER